MTVIRGKSVNARLLSAVSAACLCCAVPALSQEVTEVEEIIVTATRSGSLLEQLPVSVSVADQEAVEQQARQNRNVLSGLEAIVPGLNPQNSESRGSCLTRVRGRPVSFQLNGVPVNEDLRQGSCTGPFTLSPFAIDRIEVVRGGTALFGAGAPGGIINLRTKRGRTEALEIEAIGQTSFNTSEPSDTWTTDVYVGAGQRRGAFDFYLGAGYTDGGRVRDAEGDPLLSSAYDAIDLVGSFGLSLPNDAELTLVATFHEEDVGQQFYPSGRLIPGTGLSEVVEVAPHPQVDQGRDRNATVLVSYAVPDFLGHEVTVSGFAQEQSIKQRDNFFDVSFGDDFFASNRENSRLGFRSAATREYAFGPSMVLKTTYGIDYTENSLYRFVVDAADNQRIESILSPEVVLETLGPFVQADLSIDGLTVTAGVRREDYSGEITARGYVPGRPGAGVPGDIGDSDLTLINVGAIYRLRPGLQVYGGFSQGAELSQLGRAARNLGDPSRLTPEPATSDQYEVGVRGSTGPLRFGGAVYYSGSDSAALLQADPTCAGITPLCPLIPLRAPQRFSGVEADLAWTVRPDLDLSAVFTLQEGEVFDDTLSRYINYATDVVVPIRLTLRADWSPTEALDLGLQVSHYGSSSFFTPAEEGLGFIETEAVTLLSGSASYDLGPAEIYVAADNLLNEDYISPSTQAAGSGSFAYYRGAGRRVTLGIATRF
jgi:iron complex outermembrane recepter protein